MERQLYQIGEQQLEFRVFIDPETERILDSDPNELLDFLFQNDPEKVFLLRGGGFTMDILLLRWITKYKDALDNGSSLEIVRTEIINETIQDVTGFYFEYLTEQDIFPIDLEFRQDINDQKIVFAPKYNDTLKKITENQKVLTGTEEREGALTEGINMAIDLMVESGPETIVMLNSPSGWTGMSRDGKDIVFSNNQTYVYWINSEGDLQAVTIRTDIDLQVGEKLVGIDKGALLTKERIKEIVKTPISLHAESIESALDLIEEASGVKLEKQRNELINRETLFTLNKEAYQIVEQLKSYLSENITHLSYENIRLFTKQVGKAVLDLRKQVLQGRKSESYIAYYSQPTLDFYHFNNNMDMYRELAGDVQKLVGCNGGGGIMIGFINNSFGISEIQLESSGKYVKKCGNCGVSIEACISKGYRCSSCGGVYEGC